MSAAHKQYIGRFAPSPTGPLHFGSAVAAIASFLDARANNGKWLVRIEDLDPPREQAGAAQSIIDTLQRLGMQSDEQVIFQSERSAHYQSAVAKLGAAGRLFPCGCTRREIGAGPYSGACRNGLAANKSPRSTRFKVEPGTINFIDKTYGAQSELLAKAVGDFNIVRADGLFSYHLAVVVDDAEQGITDIVRGVDLLASTARQIALQRALNYPTPDYRHFPVVNDAAGNKLSKQTGAQAVDTADPIEIWQQALTFLNQIPAEDYSHDLPALINWAIANWQPTRLLITQPA